MGQPSRPFSGLPLHPPDFLNVFLYLNPIQGQITNSRIQKHTIPIRLSRVPKTAISRKEMWREAKANAEAGVAIGRINAKLLGRMTVIVATTGEIPKSVQRLKTGGSKMAITAELLIKVVNRVDKTATVSRKATGEVTDP